MLTDFKTKNIVVLAIALIVASFEEIIAGQVQILFVYPSAYIASFFLGSGPIMTVSNEVLIPMAGQFINVTSKCSAFGFACLLYAILMINLMNHSQRRGWLQGGLLALPVTVILTILVNGCRIICAFYLHKMGQLLLPLNFQAAIHQGVGIAIFLTTLILVTLFFERINCRERKI